MWPKRSGPKPHQQERDRAHLIAEAALRPGIVVLRQRRALRRQFPHIGNREHDRQDDDHHSRHERRQHQRARPLPGGLRGQEHEAEQQNQRERAVDDRAAREAEQQAGNHDGEARQDRRHAAALEKYVLQQPYDGRDQERREHVGVLEETHRARVVVEREIVAGSRDVEIAGDA
jgi:hypothetical protein